MGLLRGSRTSSNNSGGFNNNSKSNGDSLSLQPNDDKQLNLSAAVDDDENNLTTSHDNSVELKLLLRKLVETTTTADASKEGAAVQSWNGKENNNSKKNDNNDDDDDFVVNNDNSDGATHQKDDDITKLSNATTASQQQQQLGQQQQMLDLSHFTKATTLCQDDPTFVQHHSDNQKSCSDLFGEEEDTVGGGGEVNEEKKKTTRMIVCETDIINDELSSAAEGGEEEERKKVKDFCKRSCGLCNNNDLAGEIVINDEGESGGGKSNKTSEVGGEEEVEEDDDDDDEEGGGVVETTLDEFKTTTTNDGTTTLTKATKKEGEEETQIDEGTDEKKDEKTALLAEEGEEEKNENDDDDDDDGESVEDDNQTKKENNVIGIKGAEMEKITLKEVDEDDAFIPDNDEVKGGDDGTAKKQVNKGTEGGNDKSEVKDYMSAQEVEEKEEKDTETHAGSEEEVSVTVTINKEEVSATDKIYDEQQLVKEMESKLETALEEGFVDEDTAEKLEEEMEEAFEEGVGRVFEKELEEELGENGGSNSVSGAAVVEDEDDDDDEKASNKKASSKGGELEAATTTEEVVVASSNAEDDSSALCQDDSNFNYKGYDGFNCHYIKENKPDKCDKLHDGVKVGLVSCPVSCAMVDECMALQKQLNNGAVEEEKRVGEQSTESQEEEAPASISNIDESATEQKDELQLEKEMESELETALEKGTIDENTAEKLDEEMFEALEEGVGEVFEKELEEELGLAGGDNEQEVAADQASSKEGEKEEATKVDATDHLTTIGLSFNENASTIELDGPPVVANLTIGEDDLTFCQDDPDFKYKGYEGFNCGYIKENKPDKCDKLHDGEKVGVVFCPVSCGMVDECKALQESKVDAALENLLENKETVSSATLEGDTVATGTTAEETVEDGSEETLKGQTSVTSDENNVDADDTLSGLCQDDPDFNFKGYAGFNCDYIKENKPEKCEKLHEGEKVGTVFCPVSCNMIDECMTLQKQKGSADDTQQLSSAENETVNVAAEDNIPKEIVDPIEATVINEGEAVTKMNEGELVDTEEVVLDENSAMTDEDETKDEINVEIIPTKGVCQDDPDFIFKGYDGLNCEYIKNNKPEKCDKLHFGEKIGVVSCPVSCDMVDECMARQQVKESSVAEIVAKENEEIGDETGSKVEDEVQVGKQVTTIPSKSQEDDDLEAKEEQGLDGKELEMEIEAKLEKAVEEGELDEEEAEELEYEMDEALEEGAGEIFEEELDKELICKDDPEFLYMDGDLERDCLWIHQNERCDHVHKDTGKVIGKFFCPETCGMKEECEKVTAADASLHTPEVEDKTSGKEGGDAFEAVPKGTKSMADEIGMESEIENGNIYDAENLETISGGDTATNSFAYQNDDAYADKDGNFNSEGDDVMYNKYQDTANLNQWDNMDMDGLPLSQEYNQKPNFQPTNVVDNYNWQDEENEREGNSFEKIDYDENWLDDDGGFPFGFLILLFIGVGFFIFRKSQNQSSRQQDNSRGGYQRVGRRIDVQEHNKRY